MYQTWKKLLFLHWPVAPERLRPLIPAGLEIDTWEGTAWVGVSPLTIEGLRPPLAPSLPAIGTHELNVRTYVQRDGIPGVWFLSLDASNPLAVWGARMSFFLPYFHAAIELETNVDTIRFHSTRKGGPSPMELRASWQLGPRMPSAAPDSRDFFLVERYCLYTSRGGRLYRARIHHQPWPLREARIEQLTSNIMASHGLPEPEEPPVVHAQAEPLNVGVWRPRRVG